MRTHINLPFPVSVNGLYANRKGGRRKTEKYKAWIAAATVMGLRQVRNHHAKPVSVNIFATPPDKRRRDIDNIAKGVLDFLVDFGVLADDSLIKVLHIEWSKKPQGMYVIIEDLPDGSCT
jgi:crossover junction endodeoxyribonuclease RusA